MARSHAYRNLRARDWTSDNFDSYAASSPLSVSITSRLSLCGKEGSECPLMVHITYTRSTNSPPNTIVADWFRGFYYEGQSSGTHKKICASCLQDHVDTNPSVWYTFDSGNLLNLIAEDRRPAFINAIQLLCVGSSVRYSSERNDAAGGRFVRRKRGAWLGQFCLPPLRTLDFWRLIICQRASTTSCC